MIHVHELIILISVVKLMLQNLILKLLLLVLLLLMLLLLMLLLQQLLLLLLNMLAEGLIIIHLIIRAFSIVCWDASLLQLLLLLHHRTICFDDLKRLFLDIWDHIIEVAVIVWVVLVVSCSRVSEVA